MRNLGSKAVATLFFSVLETAPSQAAPRHDRAMERIQTRHEARMEAITGRPYSSDSSYSYSLRSSSGSTIYTYRSSGSSYDFDYDYRRSEPTRTTYRPAPAPTPTHHPYGPPKPKEAEVAPPVPGNLYEVSPELAKNSLGMGYYAAIGKAGWASIARSVIEQAKGEFKGIGYLVSTHNAGNFTEISSARLAAVLSAEGIQTTYHSQFNFEEVKQILAANKPIIVVMNILYQSEPEYALIYASTKDSIYVYSPTLAQRYILPKATKLFPNTSSATFLVVEGLAK